MFGRFRKRWRDLLNAKPGRRFQNRYYGRKQRRSGVFTKLLCVVVGSLLMVAGIVLLPAPGPGLLVIFLGAAMVAQESLLMARACDWVEVKARALARRARKRAVAP